DLLRYAFGVAGTVGLMMHPLLGCRDADSRRPAVALGVAMQLTNIARDLREDLERGRCYVPSRWPMHALLLDPAVDDATRASAARAAALRLLALADPLYALAAQGFADIPLPRRWSIDAAARMYRAIGGVIERSGGRLPWDGRARVLGITRLAALSRSLPPARSAQWPEALERELCALEHDGG
ncbi:MAG: phytoene/squalene synthase family protein, partial [Silanimonas sp.]